MCSSNDSRSCQFCSHILTLEWLCSGLLQTNQKHTWHANICKQICSPSQIACLSMWNIRHRQRWIVVINMAWDEDVCAKKKEQLLATNFTCFAWHHVNALEMCNEKKTKGEKGTKMSCLKETITTHHYSWLHAAMRTECCKMLTVQEYRIKGGI